MSIVGVSGSAFDAKLLIFASRMAGMERTAVRPLYGLVIGKRTCSRAKREGGILYELSKGWAV
jgi:hypothetical protein